MVHIRTNKRGEIVLSFELFSPLNWVITQLKTLFSALDVLTAHHGLLTMVGALGLGFGMGITVFRTPSLSLAAPEKMVSTEGVQIERIALPSIETVVYSDQVSIQGHLSSGVISITDSWLNPVFKRLKEVQLGQALSVTGSNNGLYQYHVVEIISTSPEELHQRTAHVEQGLIITSPTSFLSTELTVIVAKQ